MTNYDDYVAECRLDPEYRRIERRLKIVFFVPDMLFRLKMKVRKMLDKSKEKEYDGHS